MGFRKILSATADAFRKVTNIFRRPKPGPPTVAPSHQSDSTCTFPKFTDPSLHSVVDDDDFFAETRNFRYTPGYEECMVRLAGAEGAKDEDEDTLGEDLKAEEKEEIGKSTKPKLYEIGYYEDDGEEDDSIRPQGPMLFRLTNSGPPIRVLE
ncbi:hypothetical protein DL98DRAFT_660922 [Cadophora sp. DSE1049]|nr:hypothetical protein DL98DRAFT_660922 [Cadophora sp. DSE1049]